MSTTLQTVCVGGSGSMYDIYTTESTNTVTVQNLGPMPVVLSVGDSDINPELGGLAVTGTQNGAILLVGQQSPEITIVDDSLYASTCSSCETTLALYIN